MRREPNGFRKGRSTIDTIYIHNHVINREVTKRRGKVFVFFADLKTAFDRLDRTELNRIMAKKDVDQHLRKKIMELERTKQISSGQRKR